MTVQLKYLLLQIIYSASLTTEKRNGEKKDWYVHLK